MKPEKRGMRNEEWKADDFMCLAYIIADNSSLYNLFWIDYEKHSTPLYFILLQLDIGLSMIVDSKESVMKKWSPELSL